MTLCAMLYAPCGLVSKESRGEFHGNEESSYRKEEKAAGKPLSKKTGSAVVKQKFTEGFLRHLFYTQGRTLEMATPNDLYMALLRRSDHLLDRWLQTIRNYDNRGFGS